MPTKARNVIGPQVRKLRSQMGLSQAKLAERLQLAGLDWGRVELAKVESRIKKASDAEIFVIASVFGVALEALYPAAATVRRFWLPKQSKLVRTRRFRLPRESAAVSIVVAMNEALIAMRQGIVEATEEGHSPLWFVRSELERLWKPEDEIEDTLVVRRTLLPSPPRIKPLSTIRKAPQPPQKRPPPWFLGMSRDFTKAISGIDRKLQGRILEAIADISSDPLTPRGDTKRALSADLEGCWRFRIGDFRLIYAPDERSGDITLLAFAGRGSAYGD